MRHPLAVTLLFFLSLAGPCLTFSQDWAPGERELYERYVELTDAGHYTEAVSVAEKWVALCDRHFGPMHPDTATSLNNLAVLYQDIGDFAKAEHYFQKSLAIIQEALPADHPDIATTLNNFGLLYLAIGDFAKAEHQFLQSLAINQKAPRPDHAEIATTLNKLGMLYDAMGDFANAEKHLLQSLDILLKNLPSDHPEIAATFTNLGVHYLAIGDFAKAERHLLEGLEISRKALPPNHPDIARISHCLGKLYRSNGDFETAKHYLLGSLAIQQEALPPSHPHTAATLGSLGDLYLATGDFAKAENHCLQSLVMLQKTLPTGHPEFSGPNNTLGLLYLTLGDLAKAEQHFLQSLAISQQAQPPGHPFISQSHNSLGMLYQTSGDFSKAKKHYLESLAICELTLPSNHPDVAAIHNNLGMLYYSMGEFSEIEQHLLHACAIGESRLAPDHPSIATATNNLGIYYQAKGELSKAELSFIQSLAILRKNLPYDHPDFARTNNNLTACRHALGKTIEALANAEEADRIRLVNWIKISSFTSEREREAYLDQFFPFDLPGTLGDAPLAARVSLWRKGSLLETTLQDKRATLAAEGDPGLGEQLRQADAFKDQLRQASLEGNKAKLTEEQIQQLESQLDNVQKTIACTVSGYGGLRKSLQLTLEQVLAAIPESSALIDFILYGHFLGKDDWEQRYAAMVLLPSADPVFVPLGRAEDLDALITRHREISGTAPSKANADELNPALHEVCRQLHQAIAAPIEAALPEGIEDLILCPDAQLHFLAFASLLDEKDRFWVENYSLRHIATARDLLKLPKARPSDGAGEIVLVGDPDLRDTTPLRLMADPKALEDAERQHQEWLLSHTQAKQPDRPRGANLSQLPGAHAESLALQARFQNAGWKTHLLAKENATEPALTHNVSSPLVLHLAMHGRFQDEIDLGQERRRQSGLEMLGEENQRQQVALKNPMNGSYLALASAQTTLEQWSRGKVPPLRHDGVLTAAEVASLQLEGTLLVTLSACETGLGRAQSGEGVLGLQRGFALAGAENLLLTLWQIGDGSTGEFMKRFYDRLLAGEHPAHILPQVQREMLVELREKEGLWKAVNAAAPFTLMSHTAVPPRR